MMLLGEQGGKRHLLAMQNVYATFYIYAGSKENVAAYATTLGQAFANGTFAVRVMPTWNKSICQHSQAGCISMPQSPARAAAMA